MWLEINYSLETEQGIRHLVLKSNYKQVEQGLIDDGDYSVFEDLTPFDSMTEEEIDTHYEKAAHWDAEPYLDTHGVFLGTLHVNLPDPSVWTWDGKSDDLDMMQQAQIVEYLTTTDFDPDYQFEDEDYGEGDDVFAEIEFGGKSGLQEDGSIHLLEQYKTNVIRVELRPSDNGFQVFFEGELVGCLVYHEDGHWHLENGLFHDDALIVRLGQVIDEATC